MILGVFLAIGESFSDFAKKGQDSLIIKQNLLAYSKIFERVYVFSYANERFNPLPNVFVLPNRFGVHRYIYALLLPLFYYKTIYSCDLLRGFQLSGGVPGCIAKWLWRNKFVINYGYRYARFAYLEGKPFQAVLYLLIEPIVLNCADGIILTTPALKKGFSAWSSKIVFIPNGVNEKIFKPQNYRSHSFTVLYVGRLERMKNLNSLIKAVALIQQKIRLVFIGSGKQKNHLKSLARYLKVHLDIKKAQPHSSLPLYFGQVSIFVLPSLEEGHPKTLLEAMASGLPVIGNRVQGIKELIHHGENGLLCDGSPAGIARAIGKIMRNEGMARKLGRNGRKFIMENFTLNRVIHLEQKYLLKMANYKKDLN